MQSALQVPRIRSTRWASSLGILALTTALNLPLSAMHPNHPLGSDPERTGQGSAEGIDNIDLFSGALSVAIPIGPFILSNSSSVWHYETAGSVITARPDYERTAGIGWNLGWGELYHPNYDLNESDKWLYIDRSGGRHSFYPTLHHDDGATADGDTSNSVFYTRDGSYLRMTLTDGQCSARIEQPDGTTHLFADYNGNCGPDSPRRARKIWSPFTSEADPDVTIDYLVDPLDATGTEDTLRTVTNRYGLTHKVYLSDKMNGNPADPIHSVRRIVTRVELESFGGQVATYSFTYRQTHLDVSCKASPSVPRIEVPHLERIDLPDGTSYSMVEGGQLLYENQCRTIGGFQVDDLPGVLTGINLPTGGKIRWDYQRYEFPPGDTSSVFNTSAAVKTRTLHSAGVSATPSNAIGTWTYKATSIDATGTWPNLTHPERHIEVVFPTGHCSKHFFDAIYWVQPSKTEGWERGLPFVKTQTDPSGTRYLSQQIWTANNGSGSCSGTNLRSNYLRFRHDTPPGQAPGPGNLVTLSDFYNTNREVYATRTVFHDDGDWYVGSESSDFDGLGHLRRVVETSNLNGSQQRETTVSYSRSTGTYPGTYQVVPISEPWALGIFDSIESQNLGATGVQTVRSEFSFDNSTGFLGCTRVLASGGARGATDLLTTYSHDSLGNVIDTKLYGGDRQALSTSGSECGTVPSQPDYWTSHEYDPLSGALTRTRPRLANGNYGPFPTYDVDVEPRTGIVIRERDTAGFQITYTYDSAGRPVSATPQKGAVATHAYANASVTPTATATLVTPARLTTTLYPAVGGAALAESQMVLDDFGRTRLERQKLPGGVWSERETLVNARGWTTSISEWGNLSKKTLYLGHDALGRPTTIRPPDGSVHDVALGYRGERVTWSTVKRALAGGEAATTQTNLFDGFGRLTRVWENSGPTGGGEYTSYEYDAAGRLTRVSSPQQVRSFNYDGRGFLTSETHPEKGTNGNGSVTYGSYDAFGLPHTMTDGPNNLSFSFDFMGRPLDTRDLSKGNRLVKRFRWDGPSLFGKGKPRYASRYNFLDLPWNSQGEEAVEVRQVFDYQGVGGAITKKTTRIFWSSENIRFRQYFSYDDLGNITWAGYPYCDLPSSCKASPVGTGPRKTFQYDQGLLTAVPGWISQITYHNSGLWKQIQHSNGVTDHQQRHASFLLKPARISTSGVSPGFDTGSMTYDGAGNLVTAGSDRFTYDKVGRLVDAYYPSLGNQNYGYDRHGNITSVGGSIFGSGMQSFSVDPATNRLTGATYDGAGNMLLAPPSLPPAPFTYNTDNRLTGLAWLHYFYDAFGERAGTLANVGGEAVKFHLRDLSNRLVSNVDMAGTDWSRDRDFIFAGDRLVARDGAGINDVHFHLDHLGSVRLSTDRNGYYAGENHFLPYGERIIPGSTADSPLFAGPHERDFSTGADYMHARHYWWKLGRFLSPDPILGSPATPQSWNRYAYVMGNPINLTDPTGLIGEDEGPDVDNASTGDEFAINEVIYVDAALFRSGNLSVPAWAFSFFRSHGARPGSGPVLLRASDVMLIVADEIEVVGDDPGPLIDPSEPRTFEEIIGSLQRPCGFTIDASGTWAVLAYGLASMGSGMSIHGQKPQFSDRSTQARGDLLALGLNTIATNGPRSTPFRPVSAGAATVSPRSTLSGSGMRTFRTSNNPRHVTGFYDSQTGGAIRAEAAGIYTGCHY